MTFREQIIALDDTACRNPLCISIQEGDYFTRNQLSVHHIEYKSHGGKDVPENAITLCAKCDDAVHNGQNRDGKGRVFMLSVLESLQGARDFRWQDVLDELRLRYAS